MISSRRQIIELIEQGVIPAQKIEEALVVARVTPDSKAWRSFIDRFLLWLGGLCISAAVMFFIAYNWHEIGRFGKFGLIEGILVLAILAYCKVGAQTVLSKVSLLAATIFLGVLLALYGQVYQTGADPWQLFCIWAVLMLPWAIISRFPALWIVWVVLMNVALFLYYQTFAGRVSRFLDPDTTSLWLAFCFNTLVLGVWELMAKKIPQLSERWAIRLLAVSSGVPINVLVLQTLTMSRDGSLVPWQIWAGWLAVMSVVYRKRIPDLFMLACCCLSGIIVVVFFLSWEVLNSSWDWSAGSFLFLALLTIGMGAGAAFWLKKVHQEFQS